MKKIVYLFISMFVLSCSTNRDIKEISGKWKLYNNRFILSDNLKDSEADVELYFSGGSKRLKENKSYSYGSIRQSLNVEPGGNYSLYISGILSSAKIWIDNKLLAQFGEIGDKIEDSTPDIKRSLVNFTATSDKVDIVIEFSNFYFRSKYLFKWIVYGESSKILSLYIKNQSKDYITTGMLIICSILFLLVFFTDIRNRYNLYFALFTLSYGIRSFLMKNTTIENFLPWFNWIMTFQLNKASELWALTFILLFFVKLYPLEFNKSLSRIISFLALTTSFLSFIPLDIFNRYHILLVMHIQILIAGGYIIARLFTCVIQKRHLSKLTLITMSLFFSSIVFDIFASRTVVLFDYYSAQIVVLVVAVMFLLIAKIRSDSSHEVYETERINSNIRRVFSKFVPIEILVNLNNSNLNDRPPGDYKVEIVTMIFIDIRDFTKLSEGLTPRENFAMINDFYEIVGSRVNDRGGYVESYGGDGVKAIFPGEPDESISAALSISREVAITSGIKIGISIHYGKVVLGTIGGGNRIQATAISDVTRTLGAMDQFNSKMNIEILITDKVFLLSTIAKENIIFLGNIQMNNDEEPLDLYQLISENDNIDSQFREAFENGVDAIMKKEYSRAYEYFQLSKKLNPNHQLTITYLEELEEFLKLRGLTFNLKL